MRFRATLYCFAEFIAHSIEIHAPYTHSVHPCLLSRTHIVSGRSYARSLSRQLFGASVRLQGTAKGKKIKPPPLELNPPCFSPLGKIW